MASRAYGKTVIRSTILTLFVPAYGLALVLQVSFATLTLDTWSTTATLAPATLIGLLCGAVLDDVLFAKLRSVESLAEDDAFFTLRADASDGVGRLALFMQSFYRAIQLGLDDDDERLSQHPARPATLRWRRRWIGPSGGDRK